MVHFEAQPEGLGQFLSAAALVVVHLELPNVSPPALPRIKTDTSAAVNETSTDPIITVFDQSKVTRLMLHQH